MVDRGLLALNPDATIDVRCVGHNRHKVVVVDDFYLHPERLRDLADRATYSRDPAIVFDYPGERALIPGDTERKTRADRTKNGVPLPDDTWAAIVNTAREVGVSEVSIQRATA